MSVQVVSTVLAPAASYDLTDLTTVKDELSLDPADMIDYTWLLRAVSQVSRTVMTHVNRVFVPEYVQDLYDIHRVRSQIPSGQSELQLSRWPVLSVASVVLSQAPPSTNLTLVENTDFRVDYATGALFRLDAATGVVTAWEPLTITVKYSAGYGAAVQETHAVPATPYKVLVAQALTFSCDQSVSYANGTVLTPVAASPAVGQYSVTAGVYTFAAADTGQTLSFAYCTKTVPMDVVDATLQLVTARYRARGRDPALVQQDTPGLGTQRFWFGGAPGQTGPFSPDIEAMLDHYKVPVVG